MTTAATSFEQPRMEIGRVVPPFHRALVTLGNQVELDPRLRERAVTTRMRPAA